ncbi:MAG: sensor histidine kinase, partial [Campylobacterota bacterium]
LEEFHEGEDCVDMQEVKSCKQDVSKQINHLIEIIDGFRKFLRPNTNIHTTKLSDLFDSVKLLLKDDLIKHQINLDVKCPQNIRIKANESEIKHLFISLISNSKDAFNSKKNDNKNISITVEEDNGKVAIEYEDNAGGIPQEIIAKMFEPHVTTKSQSGGTGIGLYMVQIIIDKYDGNISVENTKDGACFTILF